jgi:GntR family transcriptional regulator
VTTHNLVNLFSLNTSSGIPIYRQLIDQIKQAIRMNLLNSNEQLPSVRNLASALQINPMTISKAYAQLELEGVLIRKRGVGMLVAEQTNQQSISAEIETALAEFVQCSRQHKLDDETIMMLVQQALSVDLKGKK